MIRRNLGRVITNKWLLIFCLALLLRVVISYQSFWHDEAATLVISTLPFKQIIDAITADFHPPLFYMIMSVWMKLGVTTEWFLRLPNIFFGVVTAYVLGRMVYETTNREYAGLYAFLLLAINPLHVYYSQELRMYSLAALLGTTTWYFLIKKSPRADTYWLITSLLGFYTFYGLWINWLIQILWLTYSKRLKVIHVFAFIGVAPWLPVLFKQLEGGKFIQEMFPGWAVISGKTSIKSVSLIFLKFVTGRINIKGDNTLTAISAISVLYVLFLVYKSLKIKESRVYAIWLFATLFIATSISFFTPILGYWRYITLIPPFIALISIYVTDSKRNAIWGIGVNLIFGFCLVTFWMIPSFWREDWKSAEDFISKFDHNKTVIVTSFIGELPAIKWYMPEYKQVYTKRYLNTDEDRFNQLLLNSTKDMNDFFIFDYLNDLSDSNRLTARWFSNAGFKLIGQYDFNGVGIVSHYRSLNVEQK